MTLAAPPATRPITDRTAEIERILERRVMVMDGSWGVMLQSYRLSERDFRGDRFAEHELDLRGCMDVLVLTQPHLIRDAQTQYLDAGADILTTNTFTATRYGLLEFGLEDHVYEINRESARLARELADDYSESDPEKPRFVAGSVGPTNKTLSISPDVNDPRLPRRVVRRACGDLLRRREGTAGRRRAYPPRRNDLRHPERQGRAVRHRERLRGCRRAHPGDGLVHRD